MEKNASPAAAKPASRETSREDRLAAALRENLRRRKEQGRDRQAAQAAPAASTDPAPAAITDPAPAVTDAASGDDSAG